VIPWGDAMLLNCRDLGFGWDSHDIIAMDRFEVARGERVFVCGPSGSGKSTLLSLLAGIVVPRRGHIRIEDIGYIFQQFNLLPYLSVVDNVLLSCAFSPQREQRAGGPAASRLEAVRLLTALGLDDARLRERRVTELSVGQQQRVAAARALIGGPALIIADEPTSALDSDARDVFLRLLLSECGRGNSSLVFVSHDMALARHFDRVVRLGAGSKQGAPA
jgi:putative ABC transport system ATP-binding protein